MNLTDQLKDIAGDLQQASAEGTLMLGAILLLVVGLVSTRTLMIKITYLMVLAVAFYFNLHLIPGEILVSSLFISQEILFFSALFVIAGMVLLVFKREGKHSTEFYFFILAMLAGCLVMMKANNLLVLYLAIESVSLTSYILTSFSFRKAGFEAGIKYLLFGAMSSAIMLFGLGLVYGVTHSFYLSAWDSSTFQMMISQVGLMMMLMGLFFKISIVPSHIWVPATYQTAPVDAVAFMSIVPKIGAIVLLKRMYVAHIFEGAYWVYLLLLTLGIATISVGTLGAFGQSNVRRMVSFGAIAHSGFLLPFAFMADPFANQSFWYYSVIYMVMNMAVFYVIDNYERKGIYTIEQYSTVGVTWMAVAFTFVLVSLIGLPPLAGFLAKFFLFTSLWEHYQQSVSNVFLWYLVVSVLATVGSLFFYFRIPTQIFLHHIEGTRSLKFNFYTKIIATLFTIMLLLLFFAPKLVMVMQHVLNNRP